MTPTTLPPPGPRATLDDLMRFDGKAELISGEVVPIMASGRLPARVAGRIYRSLDDYAEVHGGEAFGESGYTVPELPSGRESFAPDASYARGGQANERKFIPLAPVFAVEVRSDNDYGPKPDREYAAKRADYFAAGTLVVWDVDPVAGTVRSYRASDPAVCTSFGSGDIADAEPAVPGWRVSVDWLMRPGTNR